MSSEVGERRATKVVPPLPANGTRPSEPENLPCPRCDSTSTKFCYYNNYNLSQPRHFCKSCRRYWTRGGTLRNIPVGGGTRKNSPHNKRPRTDQESGSGQKFGSGQEPHSGQQFGSGQVSGSVSLMGCGVNLNESVQQEGGGVNGTFTSLLTSQVGGGLLPLGGFGLGLGGFGLGNIDWPMEQVGGGGGGGGNEKWQLNSGHEIEGGGGDDNDDCFGNWPDLAISAPGTSLK